MTKTTYHVPGFAGTRTSERPYTHALVGVRNLKAGREMLVQVQEQDKRDHAYYAKVAAMQPGELNRFVSNGRAMSYTVNATDVAKARDVIEKYGTNAEAYAKARAAERLAAYVKLHGTEDFSAPLVLQWSMSMANAAKAISSWQKRGFYAVHIAECQPK